jgi:hypothetical protein
LISPALGFITGKKLIIIEEDNRYDVNILGEPAMNRTFWILTMAALLGTTAQAFDLTGDWDSDGAGFYIRQVDDNIWWYAEDSAENPAWTSVARGTVEGDTVSVTWVDVPKGNATIMGTAVFDVVSEDELLLVDQTGGFGGEDWEEVRLLRIKSGF